MLPLHGEAERGASNIKVTAALSIAALLLAVLWQLVRTDSTANNVIAGTQTTTTEALEAPGIPAREVATLGDKTFSQLLGSYVAMKQSGTYTDEMGERVAESLAKDVRANISYDAFKESELQINPDISYESLLTYRADLRAALEPLLRNNEPEMEIFGRFVESGDRENLKELAVVSSNYKDAAQRASKIRVPKDAASYHVAVVNSLLEFSATLDEMVKNSEDSMATLALLRTYNTAEAKVFHSFNSLASYQKRKIP